ncbi:MAG: hypothetical protein K9I85_15435 [Saprospiraceae bacterium]|nr:hypothetical protein [Saprospiraceae bacterium]
MIYRNTLLPIKYERQGMDVFATKSQSAQSASSKTTALSFGTMPPRWLEVTLNFELDDRKVILEP